MTIEVRWGSATHAGRVRPLNQDAVLAGPNLFVVADGMGGHAAGDVASGVVIARMAKVNAAEHLDSATVLDGLSAANDDVCAVASNDSTKAGMGTTVAGVALVPDGGQGRILAFNIGDSRVYRSHLGELEQISTDHSVVAELVAAGEITQAEAAIHPERNVVTRAVGILERIDIDSWELDAHPGDRYLVCSDGLTNELSSDDLGDVLRHERDPQQAAEALLSAALDRGARDNVSLVIVEVVAIHDERVDLDDDTNPRAALAPLLPVVPAPLSPQEVVDDPSLITGVPSSGETS